MSKVSRSRFPLAAAPTMVVIRAPRHRPPRPSTIGCSDRDAALALHPNWPRLCTHQAFHTSNRIVRSARPSMAPNSTVVGWYSESSIKPYPGPRFCLVESSRGAGPAADLTDEARRRGEQAMREAFTGRHGQRATDSRSEHATIQSPAWVGHRAVPSARSVKSCGPAWPTGLGLV
jgi:hypothetical protein